jgi:hypothetical protein
MSYTLQQRSIAVLTLILGTAASAAIPLAAPDIAVAQFRSTPTPQRDRLVIPAGSEIPAIYDEAEKIVLMPDETMPLTVKVSRNVTSRLGTILIPAGSEISGQLQPADGGSQFVADTIIPPAGTEMAIDATSKTITDTETIRKGADTGDILKKAAIGAAAAAAIAEITGDIDFGEVLIGAGLGAISSLILDRDSVEVVVVDAETDLDLTLQSDLTLR